MPATSIDSIQEFLPYVPKLNALGYRTTDQVLGAAGAARLPLAKFLKIDLTQLDVLLTHIPQPVPAIGLPHTPPVQRLGVRLDLMPRRANFATAMSIGVATTLPASTNLIAQMSPVRDQGNRGTCVAHATTAIVEQYWNGRGQGALDLSRQFAYWNCKQHDGHTNEEGTWISIAMPLLQSDGCPLESVWPYVPNDIPNNESQDPPPQGAADAGVPYKIPGYRQLAATAVMDLKAELAEGRAVAFSIPVFDSWYRSQEVIRTGDIPNPIPGESADGGHAMCLVGYSDDPSDTASAGGRFLIRNSWNGSWATQSSIGTVGYGTIPYSYISRFALEAFSVA